VDVISRTRQLALLNSSGRSDASLASVRDAGEGKVLRWIDLIDPRSSQLKFPTEPAVAWAVVDDPIHMRELAFPDASEHQHGWS
jgi:hypothetical protein